MPEEETQDLNSLPRYEDLNKEQEPPNGASSTSDESQQQQQEDPNKALMERLEALEEKQRKADTEIAYWKGRAEQSAVQQYDRESLPSTEREWQFMDHIAREANQAIHAIAQGVKDDDMAAADKALEAWNARTQQYGGAKNVWDRLHKSEQEAIEAEKKALIDDLTKANVDPSSREHQAALDMYGRGVGRDMIDELIIKRQMEAQAGLTAAERTAQAASNAAGGLETEISTGGVVNPEGREAEEQSGPIKKLEVDPAPPIGRGVGDFMDNFDEGTPDYLKNFK